jgi:succinoglycan biosynthesis protein ExoM
MTKQIRHLVVIPTTGRPSLEIAVDSLLRATSRPKPDVVDVRILWNGTDAARRTEVSSFASSRGVKVEDCPAKGIGFARAFALSAARQEGYRGLAFFDDDQVASEGLLSRLVEVSEITSASVVFGPVVSTFPANPPQWSKYPGLFRGDPPQPQSGWYTGHVYSGNTWIRLGHIPPDLTFDDGLLGGEDTLFFWRLRVAGVTFYYSSEAWAFEPVGADRLLIRSVIRRAFISGTVTASLERRGVFEAERHLALRLSGRAARSLVHFLRGPVGGGVGALVGGLKDLSFVTGVLWSMARDRRSQSPRR